MNKIAKQLIKIANGLLIQQKLFKAKSKQTIKHIIYKQIDELTKGFFTDKYWQGL